MYCVLLLPSPRQADILVEALQMYAASKEQGDPDRITAYGIIATIESRRTDRE